MGYAGGYSLGIRCLAELVSTWWAIYVGCSVVANALLPSAKGQGMGFGWISFGYGFAFLFPSIIFGNISAIMNPAFCIAMAITGDLTWSDFIILSLCEVAGAFLGAVCTWLHWAPHFKTVPEPPPSNPNDALLRRRDNLTADGVNIASYNPKPVENSQDIAKKQNPRHWVKDVLYYVVHLDRYRAPDRAPGADLLGRYETIPEGPEESASDDEPADPNRLAQLQEEVDREHSEAASVDQAFSRTQLQAHLQDEELHRQLTALNIPIGISDAVTETRSHISAKTQTTQTTHTTTKQSYISAGNADAVGHVSVHMDLPDTSSDEQQRLVEEEINFTGNLADSLTVVNGRGLSFANMLLEPSLTSPFHNFSALPFPPPSTAGDGPGSTADNAINSGSMLPNGSAAGMDIKPSKTVGSSTLTDGVDSHSTPHRPARLASCRMHGHSFGHGHGHGKTRRSNETRRSTLNTLKEGAPDNTSGASGPTFLPRAGTTHRRASTMRRFGASRRITDVDGFSQGAGLSTLPEETAAKVELERARLMVLYEASVRADQNAKLSVFTTRPGIYSPPFNFVCEMMATIALVAGINLINKRLVSFGTSASALSPYYVSLYIITLLLGLGGPTGLSVNPARDLGPRIAHAVLPIPNKGPSEWHYGWIPVLAALVGGIAGAGLTLLLDLMDLEGTRIASKV